jgi:hypothetical protein
MPKFRYFVNFSAPQLEREKGVTQHILTDETGSRQGHFSLRLRLNCTRCISIAPAMLDRYLAA